MMENYSFFVLKRMENKCLFICSNSCKCHFLDTPLSTAQTFVPSDSSTELGAIVLASHPDFVSLTCT